MHLYIHTVRKSAGMKMLCIEGKLDMALSTSALMPKNVNKLEPFASAFEKLGDVSLTLTFSLFPAGEFCL
jgi:hypothetical protein